jgi:serine/threonine protein kinase
LNLDKFDKYGYQIKKEIGRGSYGVVYKAINTKKDKCAIKVIFATVDL